ncbi:hypothetical protein NC652_041500 [Populus alba x Populus x berolinensis]|nr:hypothetical protein NC652_041500 [Populus alba x Populus x berolinensis]
MFSYSVTGREEQEGRISKDKFRFSNRSLKRWGNLLEDEGSVGFFRFRHGHATEDGNGKPAWSLQKPSRKISSPEELTSLIYSVSLLLARESTFLVPIHHVCWLNLLGYCH